MTELLPCPFCGGEAKLHSNGKEVVCLACECCGPFVDTEAEAIAAWNTRADYHGYEQAAIEAWESIKAWNTRSDYAVQAENERTPEQAIAATLGSGECEFVIEDNMNETEGMGDVWFRCTNCHTTFDYYADDWLMKQNYCPHCGFKIRKAVGE